MAITHALPTNNYGVAHLIVATSAANGTHTTLAGAMADAVSGDTIFLRDNVTENVTLTAGVNIAAWQGGTLNTPTIIGTLTMTTAGTCNISGIRLQTNSAALLAVTGSAASIVNLDNCYLDCTNNTGFTFSTSSASARINLNNCYGDLGTTGIGFFSNSSAGAFQIFDSFITNSGASTTASTSSAGTLNINYSNILFPITLSSTAVGTWRHSNFTTSSQNVTSATLNGGTCVCLYCAFDSGTASAISIGSSSVFLEYSQIGSTNTNAITGAGTVNLAHTSFSASSNTINTTTQTGLVSRTGISRSAQQPAFLAVASLQSDVTGDSTVYTILYATEIFDQNSNFASPTFTAPYTGRYQFNATTELDDLGAGNTSGDITIVSSNRSVAVSSLNWGAVRASSNIYRVESSILLDMDAADTCTITVQIVGGTKIVDVGATHTTFSGYLVC